MSNFQYILSFFLTQNYSISNSSVFYFKVVGRLCGKLWVDTELISYIIVRISSQLYTRVFFIAWNNF